MPDEQPSPESLQKMLEIQWQDHIQTRAQTWKSLEIAALIAVAVVGVDWRFDDPRATAVAALLLAFVALSGMGIAIKSRQVEINKFTTIRELEKRLKLDAVVHNPDLPQPISFWSVFSLKSNNPLFILRMHFVLFLFAIGFLAVRLLAYYGILKR
jgi:hypothetical protein